MIIIDGNEFEIILNNEQEKARLIAKMRRLIIQDELLMEDIVELSDEELEELEKLREEKNC